MKIEKLLKSLEIYVKNEQFYCSIDHICFGDSIGFTERTKLIVIEGCYSIKVDNFEYWVEVTRNLKTDFTPFVVPWRLTFKGLV